MKNEWRSWLKIIYIQCRLGDCAERVMLCCLLARRTTLTIPVRLRWTGCVDSIPRQKPVTTKIDYIYIHNNPSRFSPVKLGGGMARSVTGYIYIYMVPYLWRPGCPTGSSIIVSASGPRGVIWNLVVRASYFNVFFTINSKSHEPDMIFSASILTFSCGSNGMGPDI